MALENIDSNQIIMGIFGSLLAFMFYGRIQDAADIVKLTGEVEQHKGELRDVWGKYNDAGKTMMDFMIEDARQKEQIKEEILKVRLEEANRELEQLKQNR